MIEAFAIFIHFNQCIGKRGDIFGRHQNTVLGRNDGLRTAAHGGDDGQALRQRFNKHDPEGFRAAGKDESVALAHQI